MTHRFLAILCVVFLAGCDFDAAKDAFEEFDVVIGLEPIETVVNGVIVDGASGELSAATLTFSGPDAAAVIDAYSDPVDELKVDEGIVTFGIRNDITPTEGSPVVVVVRATADGFYPAERRLTITETGDKEIQLTLTPRSVTRAVPGTAGAQTQTQAGASGLESPVSASATTSGGSTGSIAAATGARPRAADGTPLQGSLETEFRVFDGNEGLQALPAGLSGDGTNQAMVGGVFLKISDASGRVAAEFVGPAGKQTGGFVLSRSSGACEDGGGLAISIRSTDAALASLVASQGGSAALDLYAFAPADGSNNLIGQTAVASDGSGGVLMSVCLGGSASSVDLTQAGDPSDGLIYTFALAGGTTQTCSLDHSVTVSNIPTGTPVTYSVAGPGIQESATFTLSQAQKTLSIANWTGAPSSNSFAAQGTYTFSAEAQGNAVSAVAISDPCAGSSSVELPPTLGLEDFGVEASLACPNPAVQKFEVQVTSESLDAVSIFYREFGAGAAWSLMPRSAITSKVATDASISVAGTLKLRPSTTYEVRGVLGANSSTTTNTTPGSGGTWSIDLLPEDVGLSCVAR